jgi:hypothetical protein
MPPNDHGQHPSSGEALLALALDLAPFLGEDAGEVGKAAIDADRQPPPLWTALPTTGSAKASGWPP